MSGMAGIAKFALIGGFSGALYGAWHFGFLTAVDGPGDDVIDYIGIASGHAAAGLFYGVVVGAALRRDLGLTVLKWALFAIAASASYYAAVEAAILLDPNGAGDLTTAFSGAAAGALGALLLGLATIALSARARRTSFVVATMAAGALAGLLLPVALEVDQLAMWILFFAVWQAAYAAATAFSLALAGD